MDENMEFGYCNNNYRVLNKKHSLSEKSPVSPPDISSNMI